MVHYVQAVTVEYPGFFKYICKYQQIHVLKIVVSLNISVELPAYLVILTVPHAKCMDLISLMDLLLFA